jgi:uncharacterized protein (TIGR03435 family)
MSEAIVRKLILRSSRRLLLHAAIALPFALSALNPAMLDAQIPAAPTATTHERGDMAGDWQGTVEAGKSRRLVVRIAKAEKGWSAKLFLLDEQGTQTFNASQVILDRSTFKFAVDLMNSSYEGTLDADGSSIAGDFTMSGKARPLTLVRATKETAWEIPPLAQPPKAMAADADPAFEVATIKPSSSTSPTMQGIGVNGRNFSTRNTSLNDLVSVAYGLHAKQIVGSPSWGESDRYDIAAVPDHEGAPDLQQLQSMIAKLLVDRFGLKFHHEKRELSAYVLSLGKSGQKLTESEVKSSLPNFGMQPKPDGLTLAVRNSSMGDFTTFMRSVILDRPVVDQTALNGKFDFVVKFTPNDSEFNGHPPKLPTAPDGTEVDAAPDLFKALQDQDGLKLSAEKLPVDVLVVDHVEKPSPN